MITLASFPSPSQNVLEIGPLTIHFYGILIAIGVIVAITVSRSRYVRFGGSGELFERIAIWGVVVGFLGARAAYVITHTARFEGRPWGGAVYLGGWSRHLRRPVLWSAHVYLSAEALGWRCVRYRRLCRHRHPPRSSHRAVGQLLQPRIVRHTK